MIDTLEREREKASALDLNEIVKDNAIGDDGNPNAEKQRGGEVALKDKSCAVLKDREYVAMTMHRPSNVDQRETLVPAMRFFLDEVVKDYPIVWAIHPRAQKMLKEFGLWEEVVSKPNIILMNPLGYHEIGRAHV